MSARSLLALPPALQAVWTATYAAVVQGRFACCADADTPWPSASGAADQAEEHAWEAVRRADPCAPTTWIPWRGSPTYLAADILETLPAIDVESLCIALRAGRRS